MTATGPWILFHAPWKPRVRSGLLLLEQIERFLAVVAVDRWERPLALAPLVEFFGEHEAGLPTRGALELMVNYWFEVKRPGASTALFPGAPMSSSLMVWLGSRRINLSLRYASADPTPALLDAHAAIVNALEPKPKPTRCVLQRIIPATRPGGRERRETIG